MSINTIERDQAVMTKVLAGDAGNDFKALLRRRWIDVDLMGKTDRETVQAVAQHDLAIYLIEIGSLNNE